MSSPQTLQLTFEPLSDVGMERPENQDAFGYKLLEDLEFFVVCDGMGGHQGGQTASRLGVSVIEEQLESLESPIAERMRLAVERANAEIFAKGQRHRELRGMGTTVVVLGIDRPNSLAYVAHVGDSRIYRLRGDVFKRVTKDHTMVQRLVDDGIITEQEALNHPQSNVISRSLGSRGEVDVEMGAEPFPLESGDIFVLCSDGLHGLVSEEEIAETISALPPKEAARRLIDRANEEGGHDNVTVEVILVGDMPAQRPAFRIEHPPSKRSTPAPPRTGASTPMGVHKTARTIQIDVGAISSGSTGISPLIPPATATPVPPLPSVTSYDTDSGSHDFAAERKPMIIALGVLGIAIVAAAVWLGWLMTRG